MTKLIKFSKQARRLIKKYLLTFLNKLIGCKTKIKSGKKIPQTESKS